jgi:3-hydroxybutyryl-CoA dehydrogenase
MRGRLVVAHWFAPAQIIPLVEVVGSAPHTDTLMQQTCEVLRAVGKTPVRLNKMVNGFVINRLQRLLGREIFHLLESGVISRKTWTSPCAPALPRMQVLGVVQRYDFTGLGLSVRNFRDPDFQDPPFEEVPKHLLDRVNDGHLGVATGQGFFDYGTQTMLELQNERDRHLYRVMERLSHYVDGPRPVR